MALTYGFYNSIEGDRVYDAIQFGRIFDGIIKDGVYATYEKGMMVIASENPGEVIIQPGRAWFNHTWSYNDANVIFEAPAPEVLLERYDALVLEINEELSARENSFKWVTGTPSSRPERPTLTNTTTIHQYPLCYVHRYPETTMIYTRDITNAIGTSECPFATGVLEGIDLDAWINQWDDEFHDWENTTRTGFETWMLNQEQVYTAWFNSMHSQMDTDLAEFEAWFETIQGIIDEEAALHLQQEIDELRQEATSGSRIFVHTINESLFGKNVTITEAGGTVFTSRFDNTGVAEFKSIPYVGNLTISSTDGVQTATSVVNTPYYARYNFTIAFWAATVNIVSDPEMSGSTVTVRDSNEILVGTVVLDSEGTGIFTATAPDTYKFTLTYGGETMEVTLSVTQETTYTVDLHAAGFKWEDWLEAGGVTGSYSSLDDVLADEVALRRLFTVHASVDYMAGINKENEDVEKIIGNDLAAKWINLRDYALDTLYANTYIAAYMDTADKYFYGEWALVGQVPIMTSDSAPYGQAIRDSRIESAEDAYHAFDGNASNAWLSAKTIAQVSSNVYIGYVSTSPIIVKRTKIKLDIEASAVVKLQGSNDNSTWVDITEQTSIPNDGAEHYIDSSDNTTAYSCHRVLYISQTASNTGIYAGRCSILQFYAWQPKGNVPVMTSNTAPYGTVSATSAYSGSAAYYAFDGNNSTWWEDNAEVSGRTARVVYHFTNPICPKKVSFILMSPHMRTIADNYVIVGSNDGTNYTPLLTIPSANISANEEYVASIENDTYYMYLGMQYLKKANSTPSVNSLQFYGRELSVSVPVMTGNTTPYGEAFGSHLPNSSYTYYKAFDNSTATTSMWQSDSAEAYLGYDFLKKVCIKMVNTSTMQATGGDSVKNFKIQGSNTKEANDWHDISDVLSTSAAASGTSNWFTLASNVSSYRYIRMYVISNYGGSVKSIGELRFYGLDYSEREFEEGSTKKWLYDHGVELETINVGSSVSKEDTQILCSGNSTDGASTVASTNNIDLSQYTLLRAVIGNTCFKNDGQAGAVFVSNSDTIQWNGDTWLTYKAIVDIVNPYSDVSVDITSITQSKKVAFGAGTVNSRRISFKELWLE